ncbi:cAMP-binding proteins - catabolite gene activator and regulatory subunit of cAMP-dependent protein kinases [Candidatus Nitrotoga sp. BS]|uniref:Crp/Fnr family transcriptional regulator n=1 Tax=Candidatus Nitrotoga sp. BS TaxID=2890408 RepID=UPI001EF2A704|nr:Crp/Fnr family transcriptional regulator [Candidatus Nitrotoga sp. BS]CAH1199621.1 cAMP-binding proteins - catabolite gene activator and regulatory subunit of cAMP-dependent protein kinases [Candidatus Nitrotoga sp. BS]
MATSNVIQSVRMCRNNLLSMLTDEEYQVLLPRLELVHLSLKEILSQKNTRIEYILFPCTTVLSVLSYMADGSAIEISAVGNEGFTGMEILINSTHAVETTICQVAGSSLRMRVSDFKAAISGDTPLRRITERYAHTYMNQMAQSIVCNRLHTLEQRFARRLLITHDRVEGNTFFLTQEFLAGMLGVCRPSVSVVANEFQERGLIRYSRGHLRILDRARLEQVACECSNRVMHSRFESPRYPKRLGRAQNESADLVSY